MANRYSQLILSTAANLLGFCLFVITSLHVSNYSVRSIIDEFSSGIAVVLIFSCLFSFFSIRAKNVARSDRLETIADYFFVAALIGILTIIVLLILNFVK